MTDDATACYRHHDRYAPVACQRCARPICTNCMIQASVGFQCPECVGRNPQQVISRASLFRGHDDVVAGKVIIALNAIMFLLTMATGGTSASGNGSVYERLVLFGPFVRDGEYWRLISGGFLHSGVIHIGSNMLLLWFLAQELEPVLGRVRFSVLYLTSLLGGSLGVIVLSPISPTLGASGAVFGLMGALIVLQLRAHHSPWNSGIVGLVLINVVLTFTIPGISVGGHIGGLLAGALGGAIIQPLGWPTNDASRRTVIVAALGVLFFCAAVFVSDHFVTAALLERVGIPR